MTPPVGKVGAGEKLHQVLYGDLIPFLPVVHQVGDGVADLAQVVGRDRGGHADGDARGAVHQQVGEAGREDGGLLERPVKVVHPVHRVLIQVVQHLGGDGGQAGLGVAHRGRAVAVHRAEVALSIHQRVAQGEVLGHAGHGLVDGGVAVGMVLAQDLADDAGGLFVGGAGVQAQFVHGVEDAPLDRLEAVPDVGQRPRHDDAHRVVQVRAAHLVFYGDGLDGADLHNLYFSHKDTKAQRFSFISHTKTQRHKDFLLFLTQRHKGTKIFFYFSHKDTKAQRFSFISHTKTQRHKDFLLFLTQRHKGTKIFFYFSHKDTKAQRFSFISHTKTQRHKDFLLFLTQRHKGTKIFFYFSHKDTKAQRFSFISLCVFVSLCEICLCVMFLIGPRWRRGRSWPPRPGRQWACRPRSTPRCGRPPGGRRGPAGPCRRGGRSGRPPAG
jgi:hypothetical protein